MSEWIPCERAKPPVSMTVLLYICFYHGYGETPWNEMIVCGFYETLEECDEEGFYLTQISDNGFTTESKLIKESKQVKVLAWTLLPRKPYNEKFNQEDWSW